jgi:hypothetical protein
MKSPAPPSHAFRSDSINKRPQSLTTTHLSTLLPQPPKHTQEIARVHQFRATINNLLPPQSARRPACRTSSPSALSDPTSPLRPILQITILIHTTSPNRENNRFTEPLPPLPETRLDTPTTATLLAVALRTRRHGAARVGAARVKVQEAFGLLQRGG